ncbi:MAG: Ig-like domain repeat protein [Lachnospiraceae bacterium]
MTVTAPTIDGQNIYANGTPITIEAGTNTNTKIKYNDGTHDVYLKLSGESTEADLYNYSIYGGGNTIAVASTSITMTGGAVGNVFGGGNSGTVTGNTAVTVSGGMVYSAYGGGEYGAVNGSTVVTVSNGATANDVYGGGMANTAGIAGNTKVEISDGTVSNVHGGGVYCDVTGNTAVTVSGGTVKSYVYGGSTNGTVTGSTAVTVSGGTVGKTVFGGGTVGKVNGNTAVTVSGGKVEQNVYGGGERGEVIGGTAVAVSGGTVIGTVFGGDSIGKVTNGTTVTISGNARVQHVYGGGDDANSTVDSTAVTVSGGTVEDVFGGGNFGTVTGNTAVTVSGGTIGKNVYGGGNQGTVTGTKTGYVALVGKAQADSFTGLLHKTDPTNWEVKGSYTLTNNPTIEASTVLTIAAAAVLTVPSSITLPANTTITNIGTLSIESESSLPNGTVLNGDGTFKLLVTELTADFIQVPQNLVYTGEDQTTAATKAISLTTTGGTKTILNKDFILDAKGIDLSTWLLAISPAKVKNAGTYTASYTNGSKTISKTFTVVKSGTTFDGGITVDKTDKTYTYGDTITVTAKPNATGIAARSFTAPTANQMALFVGSTQITAPVNVGANGVYTMTYDTTEKGLAVGSNTITAKYVGNESMADYSGTVTVTLNQKAITSASVNAGATKVYDGTNSFTGVALTPKASDILGGDTVTATAGGTTTNANVGATKTFTATSVALGGTEAGYYTLAANKVNGNVAITTATPMVTVTAEKKKVNFFSLGNHDDTIILTATVTGVTGGTVPTGNVTFKHGGTTIATNVEITNGLATYEWVNPDAANYTINAEFVATANTNATGTSTAFDIDKAEQKALSISEVPNKVTYGDSTFTLSTTGGNGDGAVTYAVTAGADVVSVTSAGEVTVLKAGTATITATKAGDTNYNAKTGTVEITVQGATPTVTWGTTEQSTTHTGSAVLANVLTAPTVTLVKGESYTGTIQYAYKYVGGLTKGLFADYTDGLPTNAGEYTIKAHIAAEGNYTAADSINTMALTINKSTPTLTIGAGYTGKTYDGTAMANPTAENMTISGAAYTELTFAYSKNSNMSNPLAAAPKDAGTYYVQASVVAGANTNAAISTAVSFTITKRH